MMHKRNWLPSLLIVVFGAATLHAAEGTPVQSEADKALDDLCTLIKQHADSVTEQQVIAAVDKAAELGRPFAAELALRHYLEARPNPSLAIRKKSIESARRVGDYNAAMVRSKGYLEVARPGREASRVAADLYWMQIDILNLPDDAYRAMGSAGDKLCTGADARKFDAWYLDQARRRYDYVNMARRLAEIHAANLPTAQTQELYAYYVDWLLGEIDQPAEKHFAAAEHSLRLAKVLKDDERVKLRCGLYAANLNFAAVTQGQESVEREKQYGPVLTAASLYMAKFRDADALYDVMSLMGGKSHNEYGNLFKEENQGLLKRQFFVTAFGTLPPEEQKAMLGKHSVTAFASLEQWGELAARYPQAFHGRDIGFPFHTTADCKRLVPAVTGSNGNTAVLIRTLAAGRDFHACLNHLATREAWHRNGFDDLHSFITRSPNLKDRFQKVKQAEEVELPRDYYQQAIVRYGAQHVVKTPLALGTNTASEYLQYVWDTDSTGIEAAIDSLAWVPYTPDERKRVYDGVYAKFVAWAEQTRNKQADSQKTLSERQKVVDEAKKALAKLKADDAPKDQIDKADQSLQDATAEVTKATTALTEVNAAVTRIGSLEATFKRAMQAKTGDATRAPNPLCRQLAELLLAAQQKNASAYLTAARKLYPLVKDYERTKAPVGRGVYLMLLRPREGFDVFDFQLEVLADQLKGYDPNSPTSEQVREVASYIMSGQSDWDFGRIPAEDRDRALKLHGVLADALSARIDRGQFSQWLWDAARGTRYGTGWGNQPEDLKRTEELVDKMIQRDVLTNHTWRSGGNFATVTYMWLVRNEAKSLAEKYPVATYFDAMHLKEAAREGYIDEEYFRNGGQDAEQKIRNLAAQLIAKSPPLPVDARNPKPCRREDFLEAQSRAMSAEPDHRDAMLKAVESSYGKTRFDAVAMGQTRINLIGDMRTAEVRADYFTKLSAYLDRAAAASIRAPMPSVHNLRSLDREVPLTDEEFRMLLRLYSPECALTGVSGSGANEMMKRLLPEMAIEGRRNALFEITPFLWRIAANDDTFENQLVQQVVAFQQQGHYDLAAAISAVGLELFEPYVRESDKSRLRVARAQSLLKIGGVAPMDPNDPRFAVLVSQTDYLSGNFERSWQSYLKNRELAVTAVQQLDPSFVVWLIRRNTLLTEFNAAEELAREALQRMESNPEQFSREARARLLLAYANIALARPEYPRARALLSRIAAAKEFAGTRSQVMAELQVADVDRITKHYGEAVDRLEKLMKRKDRFTQREAHFYMAKVLFDQEQYAEALKQVETVFNYDPTHAEGRIFEGRVNLQIKRLEQASRINVGFLTDQQFIVPGNPLRVGIRDQSLAIAGNARAIEMRAWTDSGDEEHFSLVPFADSKTQFEGQVATELAPTVKSDRTLQLLGNDRVHYDFSEEFKKANNIENSVDHYLVVLSNAVLYASSGKILSKEEMEQQAMERALRAQLKLKQQEEKAVPLGEFRPYDQVKPGNPINVRVIDPDQSVAPTADQVSVTLSTTSGDQVTFDLKETSTHSGIFDGAVPTATALATALASDSEQGSQPLFAISAGDHAAWVAQPDNKRPKTFAVDLNASEQLATMKIDAGVVNRKLKQFLVQTSVDGKKFETVGSWPSKEAAWDGTMRLERLAHADALTLTAAEMQEALAVAPPDQVTITKPESIGAALEPSDETGIAHFVAAFHLPTRQMTTFQLKPNTAKGEARYLLLVDEQNAVALEATTDDTEAEAEPTLQFRGVLGQGVHRIDLYIGLSSKAETQFELLRNTDQPPYLETCPMEMFDPEQHPMVAKHFAETATEVTATEDGGAFEVAFGSGIRARVIRLLLADFETDAPAIEKIHLTARDGRKLLPTEVNLLALKSNQVLEIIPGDTVSVVYRDPRYITEQDRVREAFLSATYANGSISAALLTGYTTSADGLRRPNYIGLRRFKPEDTIMVVINDADADATGQLDTVPFTLRTGDGEPVEFMALETAEHSGVFLGKIFVVEGEPKRKSEIRVAEGEDLVLSYLDQENTDPGIPWERSATIESVVYMEPELRVFNTTSSRLEDDEIAQERSRTSSGEFVPASRTLAAVRPVDAEGAGEPHALMGAPAIVELLWPTIAQTTASTAEIYVQTSSGRENYGKEPIGEYDVNVPGTIRIAASPGNGVGHSAPPGYRGYVVVGDPNAMDAMDDGRFTFTIPMHLGPAPERSFATEEAQESDAPEEFESLVIRGGDEIFIGFKYINNQDETKWITRKMSLTSDAFFHIMNRPYSEILKGIYVGQSAYFRVIDPTMDVSDARDRLTVATGGAVGAGRSVELVETFEHSGVFKGPIKFLYADEETGEAPIGAVGVTYGEQVEATYRPGGEGDALVESIEIFKGSDGDVQPFTKRFEDPLTAVRTRLTIAEAYFELAKKHRQLKQNELVKQEIATGKRMLEEALRDYPDTEARAQVDYLLANLSLEFAEEADDEAVKKKYYHEALSRFSSIVSNYRDSTYAPKSQFKKALTLEQMGEIDRASEEYVKLSYRWPDSPLIADTIARLGNYFFHNGMTLKTQNETLLKEGTAMSEQAEELEDAAEVEKLRAASTEKLLAAEKARRESLESFTTAAKVFGRLAVRFPTHRLASKTTALSGQCFIRAKRYDDAVAAFKKVIEDEKADKEVRAESLYWAADSFMRKVAASEGSSDADLKEAYLLFKNLTLYYPESRWARYARGRLAGEDLVAFDTPVEEEP
jgi:tetratricopeptide (TPR) repeat protein